MQDLWVHFGSKFPGTMLRMPSYTSLFILWWCVISGPLATFGQEEPHPIAYQAENIATVLLHPTGLLTSLPFIPLDGGSLELRFDDLSPGYRTYEIRWQHCTFDWYSSPDLSSTDWIQGFTSLPFEDIQGSFNTRVSYTHYHLQFPNNLMAFTKSGNYLLEVYDPTEPDVALIQRRFVVYESLVDVEVDIQEAKSIPLKRTHQELEYTLTHNSDLFIVQDAYDALQTVVLQNGRWDNVVSGLEPVFVKGEEVVFSQQGENPFAGGNSWRFADLKSLQFISRGLNRIEEGKKYHHLYLEPNELRTYSYHQARTDLDGALVISNERQDDHFGGDYVMAHFALACSEPFGGQDVYVYGQCSDWMYPLTHRMQWNKQNRRYELTLFLKQGYYNYHYMTRPNWAANRHDVESLVEGAGEVDTVEGSHAAADNWYFVIAYYWDMDGYDRVIGLKGAKPEVF
jgi:hypothetical protein